eukprot:10430691-Lingulodinium_polyedra.AAC.1
MVRDVNMAYTQYTRSLLQKTSFATWPIENVHEFESALDMTCSKEEPGAVSADTLSELLALVPVKLRRYHNLPADATAYETAVADFTTTRQDLKSFVAKTKRAWLAEVRAL